MVARSRVSPSHRRRVLPANSPATLAARAEFLCSDQGNALYLCALVMSSNHDIALEASAQAIVRASADPTFTATIDHLETRRRLARLVFEGCRHPGPAPTGHPLDASASSAQLMGRLAQVSRQHREVLALCVYGGHSSTQAATALGISEYASHQLLTWGLRDLARLVDDDDAEHQRTRAPQARAPQGTATAARAAT